MGLEIRRWGTYDDTELANKDIMLENTSRVVAARAVKAVLAELISYDVVESHRSWGKREKVGVVRGGCVRDIYHHRVYTVAAYRSKDSEMLLRVPQ